MTCQSHKLYSTTRRVSKSHTNGNLGTSGLRKSFGLCTALWASMELLLHLISILPFKLRATNSHTCAYPNLLMGGNCQCEKSFGCTLQMVLLLLVLYICQIEPFSTMLS